MSYASDVIPPDVIWEMLKGHQHSLPMYTPEYWIEEEDCCDVPDRIKCLRNEHGTIWSSTGHVDHPSFTRLRKHLAAKGYIDMVTNYINGDKVLQRFILNGVTFEEGEKFPCATAMHFKLFRNN